MDFSYLKGIGNLCSDPARIFLSLFFGSICFSPSLSAQQFSYELDGNQLSIEVDSTFSSPVNALSLTVPVLEDYEFDSISTPQIEWERFCPTGNCSASFDIEHGDTEFTVDLYTPQPYQGSGTMLRIIIEVDDVILRKGGLLPSRLSQVAQPRLYPNPGTGKYRVDFLHEGEKLLEYQWMDHSGRILKAGNGDDFSGLFLISDFPPQLYFLKIVTQYGTYVIRVDHH